MAYYCKDTKIDALVKDLRSLGWGFRRGSKHGVLIAPGGRRLSIPSTPSDWRAYKNFRRDVKSVQSTAARNSEQRKHENTIGASEQGKAL